MPLQRPQVPNPDCQEAGLRPLTPEPGAQAYSQGALTETGKHTDPGQVSSPARAGVEQKPHSATFQRTGPQSPPQNAAWPASLPCAGRPCLTCPGKPCFGFSGRQGSRGHAPFSFLRLSCVRPSLACSRAYLQRVSRHRLSPFQACQLALPKPQRGGFPFSHYELRSVVRGTRGKKVHAL